jgi:4-amino-4-deoxy-L-arabinose transferase-like glycosyltransferase/membrane-associated phospholipid phosphatase
LPATLKAAAGKVVRLLPLRRPPGGPRGALGRNWLPLAAAALLMLSAVPLAFFDQPLSDYARRFQTEAYRALEVPGLLGLGHAAVILGLAVGAAGRRRTGVRMIFSLILVFAVVWTIKLVVDRDRPGGREHAFPSGDVATAVVVLMPLMRRFRWIIPGAVAAVALVAVRRITGGAHWPSDTVFGAGVGVLISVFTREVTPTFWRGLTRPWWVVTAAVAAAVMATGIFDKGHLVRLLLVTVGPGLGLLILVGWMRPAGRALGTWHGRLSGDGGRKPLWARPAVVAVGVAVAAVIVYALLATTASYWDRDEPRYVKATVEMLTTGDWLVPTFNGEWRLHKPIGIYWLMAGARALLGFRELTFRLPAVLATGASLLLTWRIGRRLLGGRTGLWAGIILATSFMMLVVGTMATTDAVLLLTILAALTFFFDSLRAGATWPRTLGLGLALGATQLIKGPVGLAVVVLTILLTWWLARRHSALTGRYWLHLLAALAIGTAVFVAWAIPANAATGGAFLREGLGEHVGRRMSEPREGHGGDFWLTLPTYIPVALFGFFPWTAMLPAAVAGAASAGIGGRVGRAVLVGWFVPTFLMMSLVATKLPHYILPVFPAMALATAAVVTGRAERAWSDLLWLRIGRWLFGVAVVAAGLGAMGGTMYLAFEGRTGYRELEMGAFATTLVLLAGALCLRPSRDGRPAFRARILVAMMLVLLAVQGLVMVPAVEPLKPSRPLAEAINARTGAKVPVFTAGYDEPSLHAYLRRTPIEHVADDGFAAWAAEDGPAVLVTTADRLAAARSRHGSLGLETIAARDGVNVAKGKWVDLVAVGRKLPKKPATDGP